MITVRSSNTKQAATFLTLGGLVAIPTETVYGLAANAFDSNAVRRIFKVKNRPFYDPLILHTNSIQKLKDWDLIIPEILQPLAQKFWPGPLTLLVERSSLIDEIVTAGLPRVAIRIPDHQVTLDMLSKLPFPVAAPSANPFGYVSPTEADHVWKHFQNKIEMVLDGGKCEVGIESTIVGEEEGEIIVYRLGGVSVEAIEKVVGPVLVRTSSSQPAAPGMMEQHYSPNQQVVAIDNQAELEMYNLDSDAFILRNLHLSHNVSSDRLFRLLVDDDNAAAARDFYRALQGWDNRNDIKRIIVERLPEFGLGRAINDRLKRASK